MSRYSPTVVQAYEADPDWWKGNGGGRTTASAGKFDLDGYDKYGYDTAGLDRAGHLAAEYSEESKGFANRRAAANAVMAETSRILNARFPELPSYDTDRGLLPANIAAAHLRGHNASKEQYRGVYFYAPDGSCAYFTVISERHPALMAGADPKTTWSATVIRKETGDAVETRLAGRKSLEELGREIGAEFGRFQSFVVEYSIYIASAGTAQASFGAMKASEFAQAAARGDRPGDAVGSVMAGNPEEALAAFSALSPRSEGFLAMIVRGRQLIGIEDLNPLYPARP